MTPDQSIQGMRKKEIKYQRDYLNWKDYEL